MAGKLRLVIVTPEGKTFDDDVEQVVLPGVEGQIGVLPGHVPLLTQIMPGELDLKAHSKGDELAVGRRFCRNHGEPGDHFDRHGGEAGGHRRERDRAGAGEREAGADGEKGRAGGGGVNGIDPAVDRAVAAEEEEAESGITAFDGSFKFRFTFK